MALTPNAPIRSSFTRKKLTVTFKLGQGSFGREGFNTVKLEGRRMSALIVKAGGASLGELQLRIWGLTLEQMNQLSTLGLVAIATRDNQVLLEAGDDETGMGVVFAGTITNGWADMQGMPDVTFHVIAQAGMLEAMTPTPPSSYRGATDVGVIMAGLASLMGLPFENNGVSVMLNNPYFPGTAREQVQRVAEAANIEAVIDVGVLAIWPKNGYRGNATTLISAETGMMGYPTFTSNGIALTSLFNPAVTFGARIKVESEFTPACGIWYVATLIYHLESELPHGDWSMRIEANPPGFAPGRG